LLEFLFSHPDYLLTWLVIFGLAVGSFINVVVYRLPIMMERTWKQECREYLKISDKTATTDPIFNLSTPRSSCPHCGHKIRAWENIPLLSYALLRGRCSSCHAPISIRYPTVEAFSGILALLCGWHFGISLTTLFAFLFCAALLSASLIDLEHKLLPDNITLPLLWLGLLINSFTQITDLHSAVIGAIAGYMSLWSVFQLFRLLTGKEGMGYGDFKLFAVLGAWLGWQYLPQILLLASVIGVIISFAYVLLTRKKSFPKIPFGPFLSLAGLIALFWGNEINQAYLTWAGLN